MRYAWIVVLSISLFSCKKDDDVSSSQYYYNSSDVSDIPDGQTGIVSNTNLSGQGAQTNVYNTTAIIDGNVVMDDLAVNGTVMVPEGDTLTINGTLQVSGGADLDVEGVIYTNNFTQIGNVDLSNAHIIIFGRATIAGGTNLNLDATHVEVNELVITGNIYATDNNVFSFIESIDTQYINRAGGTAICGNVVFSSNSNQGAYPETPSEFTLGDNNTLPTTYTSTVYKYEDNCQ